MIGRVTCHRARPLVLLAMLGLLVACAIEPVGQQPVRPQRPVAVQTGRGADSQASIKLGYHYKPPGDGTSVEALARQASFIVLTKKDEAYRDELRAAGYSGLVLHYVAAGEVTGPPTRTAADDCDNTHKPFANTVADQVGDFCTLIHPNEDWFMHNSRGERLYEGEQPRYYSMNPGSAGWRAFMLSRLKQRMFGDETSPPLGYDGIFFDNIELNLYKDMQQLVTSDGATQEYRSHEEYRAAWLGWLAAMRKGLGTSVPLWGNLISGQNRSDEWNDYLPYLDGGMNEAFATGYHVLSPEEHTNDLLQAEYVLAQGKGFYANGLERQQGVDLQPLALASYLLVMQPGAPIYFRHTRYDESYADWRTYPNYDVRLGQPLGPRYPTANGWRRDFSHGYVTVDQRKRTARIVEQPPATPTRPPTPGG